MRCFRCVPCAGNALRPLRFWQGETVPENTVVRIRHDKMPPHYMMLGTAPTGETVELIAFTDGFDWFFFHAMPATSRSFAREYRMNGGRL